MNENLSSLEALKGFAEIVSTDISEHVPPGVVSSVMVANNRVLAAAIVQNGGELRISAEAIRESLASKTHIVAVTDDDGTLRLTFASKEEIIRASEDSVPL